jgi:Fe2+ or Zn2+ uptake regulation protein
MENSYMNDFKEALKKENLKFTNQRYSILKFLVNNDDHYDCDTIIYYLKKNKIKVSKATAYRTLDLLVKYNFCRKMVLDDGIARYENKIGSNHHDHMICIDTGKIIEFVSPEIEEIQENIAKNKGYKIIKHVHQLFVKKISKN